MIFNDEGLLKKLEEAGDKRAEMIAKSKAADESRKVVLAEQMNQIELSNPDTKISESKLDRLARATNSYKSHLDLMEKYRQEMLQVESDYEVLLSNKSFLRDRNSNNTAKISQGILN